MESRSRNESRGGFVVLVGPDGSGKTTVALELAEQFQGETQYVHFRPSILRRPDSRPVVGHPPDAKRSEPGPAVVGWARLARSFASFWLGYLRWIIPAKNRHALIVGDRWIYGYIAQPAAVGYAGPAWLARTICRLAPSPDVLVRLSGDPATIAERKDDLTLRQIEEEERIWDTLWDVGMLIDVRQDPSEAAKEILAQLRAARK